MTIQEMINVLQDALDGKKIEVRYKNRFRYHDEWTIAWCPTWDFSVYDYRAKPEPPKPKYVPYETIKELDEAVLKHGAIVKDKGPESDARLVLDSWWSWVGQDGIGLSIQIGDVDRYDASELLEGFTWLDGTPCGKEVTE